jgi:hypothetical protein
LKIEPSEFPDCLGVGYERRRGIEWIAISYVGEGAVRRGKGKMSRSVLYL